MRYKAIAKRLTLVSVNGRVLYRFNQGILDLGDGNTIQPNLASSDENKKMIVINPSASQDLEKVGLNKIFWESPAIEATGGTFTLTADTYYEVDYGAINYDGVRYFKGDRFKTGTETTATEVEPGSIVSKAIPPEYFKEHEDKKRNEMHKYHWMVEDVTDWDDTRFHPYPTDPKTIL